MKQLITIITIIFYILISMNVHANKDQLSLKVFKNKSNNKIIFMRHALAPGTGDPKNFVINDCATQRNLDKSGIEQSIAMGKIFKKNNIKFTKIFSSFWCRCKDTAFFLRIGQYNTHKGLNSFYQGHAKKDETITELGHLINGLKLNNGPYLMITHYVVIEALSGISVPSGGMIIYDMISKKSKYFKFKK